MRGFLQGVGCDWYFGLVKVFTGSQQRCIFYKQTLCARVLCPAKPVSCPSNVDGEPMLETHGLQSWNQEWNNYTTPDLQGGLVYPKAERHNL